MERISRNVPEFGGYFIQQGRLVMYLTDLSKAPDAAAEVASHEVELSAVARSDLAIDFRRSRYTFSQLREWRNTAYDEILPHPDVVSLDLDERANAVKIGYKPTANPTTLQELVIESGIPSDAFVLVPRADVSLSLTLNDHIRTAQGGLRGGIQLDADSNAVCTYGFNAVWSNDYVLLMNSHCTGVHLWTQTSAGVYQPDSSGSNRIGEEVYDPAPENCGWPWPFDQNQCRYSDASIIEHETADFVMGKIARTTFYGEGLGNTGSLVIDSTNPSFTIMGEVNPIVGTMVNKVGRTTGWTRGEVIETCEDREQGDYVRWCQTHAEYESEGGDSGSPVFVQDGNNAILAGIHWGGTEEGAWFSPFTNIENDLGDLTVTPPATLLVSIDGPSTVPPYEYCTWTANVTGGYPPYSYEWSGLFAGTSGYVFGQVNTSGVLRLDVTSDDGQDTYYKLYVTSSEQAPSCEG